jgi:HD-GYP domain-containing protein (c-di-GMP phosphodiesterase class II)
MWLTSLKMAEFFQQRQINGLNFSIVDFLTDEDIVTMVQTLSQAKNQPNPFLWLNQTLASQGGWVSASQDEDKRLSGEDGEAASDGGLRKIVKAKGNSEAKIQARRLYSHALTVFHALVERLITGKKAGVQKVKRVVQEFIDLLFTQPSIYMAMTTVRDHGDQLFTHSLNVALLSMAMGHSLSYSRSRLEQLGLTALFHDLGKAGDYQFAVDKTTSLDGRDLAAVHNHPLGGVARIIRLNAGYALKLSMLQPVCEHHLGYDLKGYPKIEEVKPQSLNGKIIAVADHYEAMTSWRPFRPEPLSPSKALREMSTLKGEKLDPLILGLFSEIMGPWPVGSLLLLDSSQLCLASSTRSQDNLRPKAVLLTKNEDGTVAMGDTIDLAEKLKDSQDYKLRIVTCLSPTAFGIQPADYLI